MNLCKICLNLLTYATQTRRDPVFYIQIVVITVGTENNYQNQHTWHLGSEDKKRRVTVVS